MGTFLRHSVELTRTCMVRSALQNVAVVVIETVPRSITWPVCVCATYVTGWRWTLSCAVRYGLVLSTAWCSTLSWWRTAMSTSSSCALFTSWQRLLSFHCWHLVSVCVVGEYRCLCENFFLSLVLSSAAFWHAFSLAVLFQHPKLRWLSGG